METEKDEMREGCMKGRGTKGKIKKDARWISNERKGKERAAK